MAARDYQLTLAATAKQLSDAFAAGSVFAIEDVPYRQLLLSAEGAVAFVGAASDVSSSNYGTRVEIGAAGSPPVSIGPFETGPVKLSDLWAAGAGSTLHILGIPY